MTLIGDDTVKGGKIPFTITALPIRGFVIRYANPRVQAVRAYRLAWINTRPPRVAVGEILITGTAKPTPGLSIRHAVRRAVRAHRPRRRDRPRTRPITRPRARPPPRLSARMTIVTRIIIASFGGITAKTTAIPIRGYNRYVKGRANDARV